MDEDVVNEACHCNTKREFYAYLREIKKMPIHEKVEYSFQTLGVIWGLASLTIFLAILITWFKSEIWEFMKDPKQAVQKFFEKKA